MRSPLPLDSFLKNNIFTGRCIDLDGGLRFGQG
jgi:hypothetical protein